MHACGGAAGIPLKSLPRGYGRGADSNIFYLLEKTTHYLSILILIIDILFEYTYMFLAKILLSIRVSICPRREARCQVPQRISVTFWHSMLVFCSKPGGV
jgi:hypothetical protein